MPVSLDTLSAAQIAAGIGAGEFSATDVARAALSAIDARDAEVRAFLQVTPELALDAAARVDALRAAGEPLPPLAGVPSPSRTLNLAGTRAPPYRLSPHARGLRGPLIPPRACSAWSMRAACRSAR